MFTSLGTLLGGELWTVSLRPPLPQGFQGLPSWPSDETTGSHFMQWDVCVLSEETFAVHSVFSFPWPTQVSLNPYYLPHAWQLTVGFLKSSPNTGPFSASCDSQVALLGAVFATPGSPRRCGGGAGCPQGQGTCPEVRTRLGAPAMPRMDFGCPAPARCQPRPSRHFAARHHTPSCLQSRGPHGDEPAWPQC